MGHSLLTPGLEDIMMTHGQNWGLQISAQQKSPITIRKTAPSVDPTLPWGCPSYVNIHIMSTVQESYAIDKGGLDGSLQGYFQLEYSETSSGPEYHFSLKNNLPNMRKLF